MSSEHEFKKQFISEMLGLNKDFSERRKNEDLLQSVLSVLLEYNSEYAKGIEQLIDSDSNSKELLISLQQKTEAMRILLEGLIKSHLSLEQLVRDLNTDQKIFIRASLKTVYDFIGVTEEGIPHAPLDSLYIKFKLILKEKILYVIIGAVLIKFLPFIMASLGIVKS